VRVRGAYRRDFLKIPPLCRYRGPFGERRAILMCHVTA